MDTDSGLQYLRARYYDPEAGRFIRRDPFDIGNRYSYVANNPVNLVDPLGLCGWKDPWNCADDLFNPVKCIASIDCVLAEGAGLLPAANVCSPIELPLIDECIALQVATTCVIYPVQCAIVGGLGKLAGARADELFPNRGEGRIDKKEDVGDRFEHCFWSGLITLYLGADQARMWTTRYEEVPGNNPLEKAFDLESNELGIEYGERLRGPLPDADPGAVSELERLCGG